MKYFVKSISYRLVATITTILIVYLFTNELKLATGIGLFELIAKTIIYYIHEKVWKKYERI